VALLGGVYFGLLSTAKNVFAQSQPSPAASKSMIKVTSPSFQNEGSISVQYTCDGSNTIPPLNIADVPSNAKSLAIVVDDPDAPSGNFNHWIAWNIDPSTNTIPEGMEPKGAISGKNSAGKVGYVGPCPPAGTHRYFFKVFALDDKISLDENANETDLNQAMNGHIIGQGELMGKYAR
jgi:Raf kinase inhibitor-like YbhB/YbcL family protein